EPPDLLGLGLLHLEHERGVAPERVHVGEARAGPDVVLVADAAASARAGLDEHLVAPLAERPRPSRRQRDPLLAELDLARDADDHGPGRAFRRSRMCCANSSPASSWRKWPASRITTIRPALGISCSKARPAARPSTGSLSENSSRHGLVQRASTARASRDSAAPGSSGAIGTSWGKACTPSLYERSGKGAAYAARTSGVRLASRTRARLNRAATSRSGVFAMYARQSMKPGPGGSPVPSAVFMSTSRANRSGCSPTIRRPINPPQSWQTSVMRASPRRSRKATRLSRCIWNEYSARSVNLSDLPKPKKSGARTRWPRASGGIILRYRNDQLGSPWRQRIGSPRPSSR